MTRKPMSWKLTVVCFLGLIAMFFVKDMFFGHDSYESLASYPWQYVWTIVRGTAIGFAIFTITQRAIYGWKVRNWERSQNREDLEPHQSS
jgi:hypothetical protein